MFHLSELAQGQKHPILLLRSSSVLRNAIVYCGVFMHNYVLLLHGSHLQMLLTCLSFHPLPLFPTHSHSPFYSLIEYSWPACEVSFSVT